MPQLQNLVLTDRAATPVAHTFVPRDVEANVGTVEESTGVKIGDKSFSISKRQTPNGKHRVQVKLVVPVVVNETINGVTVPSVAYTSYVDASFTFDPKSSTQDRKDVVGMFQSAFDSSKVLVNDTVVGLQGIY
ncbi:coat protein [ssRNA phage Gephyllon.4_22]|uniref:Coat protein n=2 Tax=Fiersviridae TaxID=2842319 RepID=A0A8S5L107_9VIRU|nr:coat protein [ssRNA phage Gephyllon.4_22]QDH89433.1 MAG: hypothetical protein H4BulkLitter24509_000002 [Leviviridae sp.]DAD51313.1 TPA_asm: coat protein [ssRNA phage Gephyllon.4_22]